MHSVSTTNTCIVCIQFSSTASVAKLLSRVDNSLIICNRQFISISKTEEWTECPASRKRDSWGKKYKKHLLSSLQKTKSTQTSRSVFADRIEQVKKTKFELELIKIVDCFLDCHGKYSSNLISFEKICQFSSIDELVLPGVTGFLSTLNQFQCLWGTNCSGNGTRKYWDCLYQSWSLHILPFYHYILSILGKKILLWYQSFQCLAIVAFQLQLVLVFRRNFWSCEYNKIKSQFWFQLQNEVSIFSNVPTLPDSKWKRNKKE